MSYTSQQLLPQDVSSDAAFRVWGLAVSTAMSSSGWTKSGDTGQVNWATVTVPSSTYVYEIWQPGDGLTTFYLKLEYGFSSTSVRMRFSVGTSSDGSGNLTGISIGPFVPWNGTTNTTSNAYLCTFSGDISRFGMMMFMGSGELGPTGQFCMAIERLKNSDGTDSSHGVTLFVCGDGFSSSNRQASAQTLWFGEMAGIINQVGAAGGVGNPPFIIFPGSATSHLFNGSIAMTSFFPIYGYLQQPCTVLGFINSVDVGNGLLFNASLYGSTRTYFSTNSYQWRGSYYLCLRYD